MIDQIKSIQARLEGLVADINLISQEAGKIENRDKVSREEEARLSVKAGKLSRYALKLKKRQELIEKDREEISKYSNTFAVREKKILRDEEQIEKKLENIEILKKELVVRELKVADNEEEREKLKLEKKDFEIIQSKVEKARKLSRNRKEMLDERERKLKVKEELLKRRLRA